MSCPGLFIERPRPTSSGNIYSGKSDQGDARHAGYFVDFGGERTGCCMSPELVGGAGRSLGKGAA